MGGGIGAQIVTQLRQELPLEVEILALGTNAIATEKMMKARHGGPARVILCQGLGLPLAAHWRLHQDLAAVSRLELGEDGVFSYFPSGSHRRGNPQLADGGDHPSYRHGHSQRARG
jgi:broad specificity phosphatase PhoE